MSRSLIFALCTCAALTGAAYAQGTQATAPAQSAPPPATSPTATQSASPPAAGTPARPAAGTSSAAGTTTGGGTAQPGIRAVDPTTLRLTFYTIGPADMLGSRLIGLDVHNLQNEEIGEIEDLIIDEGKTIKGVVLSIGGFLGIGERRVAVQPGSLLITREGADNLKAVVNTTKEELGKAQEFRYEGNLARR